MWDRRKAKEDSEEEKWCQQEGYEPFAVMTGQEEDYDDVSCRYFTYTVVYVYYKKKSYDT